MKDLNKHCKEFIESNFMLQNVGRIAKRAEEIGSEELCEAAADFLVNCGGFIVEEDLKDVPLFLLIKTVCKWKQAKAREEMSKMYTEECMKLKKLYNC